MNATARILIIGRSPTVLLGAVDILRGKGFDADATNRFDDVLTDYDTTTLDVVLFGGQVPPGTKRHLRDEISKTNDHVTFVQGLNGIAGLVAAQAEGATSAARDGDGAAYDATTRTVRLTLREPARVVVDAWWITSFAPPEPKSTSLRLVDAVLGAGEHDVPVPAQVPRELSFVTASVGPAVHAFTVGTVPDALTRPAATVLPPVRAVATHGGVNRSREASTSA